MQSINQSIKQSINQSTNQSVNRLNNIKLKLTTLEQRLQIRVQYVYLPCNDNNILHVFVNGLKLALPNSI